MDYEETQRAERVVEAVWRYRIENYSDLLKWATKDGGESVGVCLKYSGAFVALTAAVKENGRPRDAFL